MQCAVLNFGQHLVMKANFPWIKAAQARPTVRYPFASTDNIGIEKTRVVDN
jgi:hypothetical protein